MTEPEKAEKSSDRSRAVRQKIQRLCKMPDAGDNPRDPGADALTLAELIRRCRRTGLHAQRKLL